MSTIRKATPNFLSTANPHDEYELIQRIGSGTYGDVYKVRSIFLRILNKQGFVLGETHPNSINSSFEGH